MSCCDKIRMLIWKQWLIEKRSLFRSGIEISLPLIVAMVLLLFNTYYSTVSYNSAVFLPYKTGIGSKNFSDNTEIIYCPAETLPEYLVNKTAELLGIHNIKSFTNIEALITYASDEVVQERLFGALEFHTTLPYLNVSLRFPEFRIAEGFNTSWLTNNVFPPHFGVHINPLDAFDDTGPAPYYQKKGFLVLQEALSRTFIKLFNRSAVIPDIYMQRFPHPSWNSKEVYDSKVTIFNIVVFMFLSFMLLFIGVIKLTSLEKEFQVKQLLETAGVHNWMLWTSYFIRSLLLFLLGFSVLLFALNTPSKESLIQYSNNLIIFIFFVCFSAASITLAFLISVLHNSTIVASTIGTMLWFLSFLPSYKLQTNIFSEIVASMFAPLAFFNGFEIILTFELRKEGLQWNNIWKSPYEKRQYCFGYILLSLFGCAIIYLMLALYIESQKFEKMLSYCRKLLQQKNVNQSTTSLNDIMQELPPSNLPLAVKTLNLSKMYSKGFKALENLSLEMYGDQITVLLGANGAGKTTAANIIAGVIEPTQGFIRIYHSNLSRLLREEKTYIGYCPQKNILFDELTVEEHIYFFSRIKGFDEISSIEEIDKYISMLQLGDKASTQARHLTEGLRRRVSIALALCAHSKIVVLDEPTTSVDPISRRAIWNMLLTEKKGRSILVTTHLIEEAEILGDRIAIICEGVLKCCGSSTYLKKQFTEGHRLMIVKGADCSTQSVLNFMKKHFRNIKVASDISAQLSFKLEKEYSSLVPGFLSDLEEKQASLGIQSFRISMPSLEEVFITNTIGYYSIPFNQAEEKPVEFLEGKKLMLNIILALLLKKMLLLKTSWSLLLMHTIFVLVIIIVNAITMYKVQTFDMPVFEISLKKYHRPTLLIDGDNNKIKSIYRRITNQYQTIVIDTKDVSAAIFAHTNAFRIKVLHRYPVGASFFQNNTVIAWYNSFPHHSAPLALNLIMNTVSQSQWYDRKIIIYNHPLPLTKMQSLLRAETSVDESLQYLMAIISSTFIIFIIREAYTKSIRQQFVCGVSPIMFWLTTLFCDIIVYLVVVALVMITLTSLPDSVISNSIISLLFLTLMCYGFASLNLCYLIHRLFLKATTGYIARLLISILGIILAITLRYVSNIFVFLSIWVYNIFTFMPSFSLANALIGLERFRDNERICTMLYESCIKYGQKENCTQLITEVLPQGEHCKRSYYSMSKFGILMYLVALVVVGLLYLVITITIDASLIPRKLNQYRKKIFRENIVEEEDVIRERQWLRRASIKEVSERSVVLKDVSKTYKRKIALNRVSLALNRYECFGLIGTHEAGKTTIFKILTGDIYTYSGDVLIKGYNVNRSMKKIRKYTLYCPQVDGLFKRLTGEQNLKIYALIRGVPYKKSKEVAELLAQKLDFSRYLHKEVRYYSEGNKRKLSTAIALMGNAQVIFLDEPEAGMDISTIQYLWEAISKEKEKGRTILLATHSMEECEAVCDRIGVLVKGKITCIGNTQRLINKFANDYILTIRSKKEQGESQEEAKHEKLMEFMKEQLPAAQLLESFKEVYVFQIRKRPSVSMSMLFQIIETHKTALNIEDYTLSESSLKQVFLSVS